jgi:ABC-type dipeptide/oligopeptide/nickel transport system permease subunit
MGDNSITVPEIQEAPPRTSGWNLTLRVFIQRKLVVVGFVLVLIFILMAIFGPWMTSFDPYKVDTNNILLQPLTNGHILGTDALGRDTLSRLIYGSRTALMVGIITIAIGTTIGIILGLLAGFFGGATSMIIMRLMDMLLTFPMLLLALLISGILGGGIQNVIIALTLSSIAPYSRVVNGQTLSVKENDYILATHALGASNLRTMFNHILPNIVPLIIVLSTMQIGYLILAEASLSFLGIGIKPPGAAWGSMINDGYRYLLTNPALSFAPGICIILVVFGFMMMGDGLRDALDPKLRGTL